MLKTMALQEGVGLSAVLRLLWILLSISLVTGFNLQIAPLRKSRFNHQLNMAQPGSLTELCEISRDACSTVAPMLSG